MEHQWDDDRECCLQCGDKDWFAEGTCKPPTVRGHACREADRAMVATEAGQELLACAIDDLVNGGKR